MTTFTGTLLKPLDQQHDIDADYIDPAGVMFDPRREFPIFLNFDFTLLVGHGKVERRADGGLIVKGRLSGPVDGLQRLAIGVDVRRINRQGITTASDLRAIALTQHHADPDQPLIWLTDDL